MDGAPMKRNPHWAGATWLHALWRPYWQAPGGCTAYDVVLILRRGRHDVRGCSVKLSAERADTSPRCSPKCTCTSP